MYAVALRLYSLPARRPIMESSEYRYKRVMRSAGVMAVCVRAGACLSGNAICAAAATPAPEEHRGLQDDKLPAWDGLQREKGKGKHLRIRRPTSPFRCALSRRGLVSNGRGCLA